MNERPEQEDFDDEAELDSGEDVDQVIRDFDQSRRRSAPKGGDPAWRRLERLREDKRTAELMSDFEDYDIGLNGGGSGSRKRRGSRQ
jgi:hypothetical protein